MRFTPLFIHQTRKQTRKIAVFAAAAVLAWCGAAEAAPGFDSISFKPATDQGYYLTTQQSQTLGQWGYAVGLLGEWSNDSVIARTATGARIRDVIEHQIVVDAGGALGLFDWLNLGVLAQVVPYHQFRAVATGAEDNGFAMGDIRADLKVRLLNNEKHAIGIALVPFITFPTGKESEFVGNGNITGGGLLVLDTKRFADRVSFSFNAGGQVREQAALSSGTTIDDQLLVGAAANVGITKRLHFIADVSGWTLFQDLFENNLRNLEGNGAFRWLATPRLAVTVGGGTGILDAIGAPDWRAFASIAYRHPKEEEAAPAPAPTVEVIRTNKIHFAFDKATIKKASYPVLDGIVSTLQSRNDIESIRVEGHTDSKGSDTYNQTLSERRAAAVMDYLISHGVPREKLTSAGMGESTPIAPNEINGRDNPAGRAENRRVEFHLTLKPGAKVQVIKEQESPTFPEGSDPEDEPRKRRR